MVGAESVDDTVVFASLVPAYVLRMGDAMTPLAWTRQFLPRRIRKLIVIRLRNERRKENRLEAQRRDTYLRTMPEYLAGEIPEYLGNQGR